MWDLVAAGLNTRVVVSSLMWRPARGQWSPAQWTGRWGEGVWQRCYEAGLHNEQKNTVDAKKEETFNKNGMTTAKT